MAETEKEPAADGPAGTHAPAIRSDSTPLVPARTQTLCVRAREWLTNWLTSPPVLRVAFAILRRFAPVLVVGKRVFVSRHTDVVEVLSHDETFSIAEINGLRTSRANGPFVLSMDRGIEHDREKEMLNAVMKREDIDQVRALVREEALACLEPVRATGRIELVQRLTRIVPLRLIESYFGVPAASDPVMMRWLRSLFHELFLNANGDPEVTSAAIEAFRGLRAHLESVIARRKLDVQSLAAPTDVLGRMIQLKSEGEYRVWLDDDAICRNISGLIIGALETTNKAAILVIDELLRRPDALRGAAAAARTGDLDALRDYCFEALRFNPFVPLLMRHCRNEAKLGTDRGRMDRVPAGTTVFALILSAMFDGAVFIAPGEFRTDRGVELLHFGHGLHRCQGRLINHVQVPELVGSILRLDNVRRARAPEGHITYDGPFPDRFVVEFDPS